jgi:hypothetical protein
MLATRAALSSPLREHGAERTRESIPVRLRHFFLVMRGLDPRIHADWPQIESGAWVAGSSPATTVERCDSSQSEHAPKCARPLTGKRSVYTPHPGRSRGSAKHCSSKATNRIVRARTQTRHPLPQRQRDRQNRSRGASSAPEACSTPPQSEKPRSFASRQRGKRSAERRIVQPMSASSAAARCSGGAPPFGAHACGTRHRLLPRWLSSRTGFPAASADGCLARFAKPPRLSTLRADRSLCRSTGDPKPPECGAASSARGHRGSLSSLRHAFRKAPSN